MLRLRLRRKRELVEMLPGPKRSIVWGGGKVGRVGKRSKEGRAKWALLRVSKAFHAWLSSRAGKRGQTLQAVVSEAFRRKDGRLPWKVETRGRAPVGKDG